MMVAAQNSLAIFHHNPGHLAFIPHGHCYLWQPGLVWLHVLSDGFTALAYFSIPIALIYFVRQRRDLPYPQVFQLFGAFIVACGLTHVMEIWTLWHPIYWFSGGLKAITAMISVITAAALVPIIPQALTLPSRNKLEAARQKLEEQVRDRTHLLHQSEERWQLALRGNNDGIWDWNVQTNEVFFSSRWKEMLGFADHEIANHLDEWSKRVHPDDLGWVTEVIQDHFAGKTPFYISEHRVLCKDGSYKWILDRGQALWDKSGHVIRMTGSHTDITERKRAEQALEKELLRTKTFLDTSIDGIVVLNHQGNVLQTSPSFAQMIGYTVEETYTLNVADWDAQWTREELQQILEENVVSPVFETRHRRKDGSIYDVEISYSRVRLDDEIMNFCICRDITGRKHIEAERLRAEALLKSSQAQFEALVTNMPGVVYRYYPNTVDSSHHFSFVSSYSQELLELAPEVLINDANTFVSQIHSEDLPSFFSSVSDAVEHFLSWHWEGRIMTPSGQLKWIEGCSQAQATAEGAAWDGILRDISDRKQAEIALQTSQARFAGILEIASDAIISVDTHQQITLFNKGAERIFGYQAEEIVGQPITQLIPDRFAKSHHHVQQYAHSQDGARQMAQRGTVFGKRKDGTEFPAEASISKLTLNGEVTFTAFLQDITARQQAEAAIAHLAAIIESSEDAIASTSLEGIVTSWNAAAENLFGYSIAEIVGQSVKILIPEALLDEEEAILERIRCGERIASYDTQRRRKDGRLIDVSISVSPIKDTEGRIIGASKIARDISQRKQLEAQRQQAEEALRQSEEKFRMAIDFTYNWEYWQAADGSFVYVSPACERITGYSQTEFIENPHLLNTIVYPDDRHVLNEHICHAKTSGFIDYRIVTKFGETRWISHICQPIFNSDGQFLGTRASNRDISEQKQAELALQESEARFQAFMNHSPAAAWITNDDGTIFYVSQTYCHNFQLPTTDLIGKSIFELYPSEVAQQFLINIQAVAKSQQVVETIEIAPKRDGTMGKFLVYKFPVPDPSGQLLVGGVAIDVTQQHQAEEELRHQKEMFQVIVDNIPVMIALFNDQGRINFINPEFERTLGWSLQEWQQRDVMVDLYPNPIYLQSVLDHMTAAMGNWRDFTTLTATKQQLETSWTNVPISRGRFLGIGQDISDRKQKEVALQQAMEAAEAANLAKSMFLANMSHELRTPLNVILGFSQVMSHDSSLTPSQRDDLQTIQRSGDHLLSLINDVLDLSKIEAGHCTLEESGFDLISLLHTLHTMMAERAKAKQLQLTFDIVPEVPQFVIADEQKLRQVLLNLLSNAIKFTSQGGVTLRVTSLKPSSTTDSVFHSSAQDGYPNYAISNSPSSLQFEVVDTGVGITVTEQESIFDAFVQAEAGRKSMSGTGLGLTISRKLLELMDGKISVHSIPNVGSTFTAIVPVRPTNGVDGQAEHQERTIIGLLPGQPHRRILVVDDQRENRLLMVRLLYHLGLEVREATNGQEAIVLWQQWKPDLTWMDIRMPGLDGYEATKQIRAMEQEKASIIIALTAQASQSDRTLALAAGCNDYISKPFREETVFLKMSEYLGLEYLYADSNKLLPNPPVASSISSQSCNAFASTPLSCSNLSLLPRTWLMELEEAAICGNDNAVAELVKQLPPEFAQFGGYLTELVSQFQFEQILNLLQNHSLRE